MTDRQTDFQLVDSIPSVRRDRVKIYPSGQMTVAACEGICENSFCSCDQSNIPNPEHISYKEENMAAARNENIQRKNLNFRF